MNRRQLRIVKSKALLITAAIAAGAGVAIALRPGHSLPTVLVAVAVLLAGGIAATLPYWRSIDDAAREAHKTAWYWGGGAGAGVGVLVAMVVGGGALEPMARGALLTFGAASVGYLLVWAAWWFARRPLRTGAELP